MSSEKDINRRKFMEIGIYAISGGIAAVSGAALTRFAVGTSFDDPEAKWIEVDIDPQAGPEDGAGFERVVLEYEQKDGWLLTNARTLAYVKKEKSGEMVAISATCSHLGCVVTWMADEKIFKCPCHDGRYDAEGRVISGPPPAPLRRHRTKMEEGRLYVSSDTTPYGGPDHASA